MPIAEISGTRRGPPRSAPIRDALDRETVQAGDDHRHDQRGAEHERQRIAGGNADGGEVTRPTYAPIM